MEALRRGLQSLTAAGNSVSKSKQRSRVLSPDRRHEAPHAIVEGREGAVCPVTGLSPQRAEPAKELSATEALAALNSDPDIAEERLMIERARARHASAQAPAVTKPLPKSMHSVPLNVIGRTHHSNSETARLVRDIGGLPTLRRFTALFYERCFADSHVDKFIRDHSDPHGERFATWIAGKLGSGTPWSDERRTRPATRLHVGHEVVKVAFDRSSAHFAAWHSPKREANKWGQHFRLDDARVWMRLHFWAAREVGMFDEHPEFMEYYTKFIGHFVRVYSSSSPVFTRESVRWSAMPGNIERYLASGNVMADVIGVPLEVALQGLPAQERNGAWPYV